MTATTGLRGHTALVTGGSRGIGAAVATALAEAGAGVAINYRERADEAKKLTEPMILPDRIASKGLSRRVALATQRRRCMFMMLESEGRRFSTRGTRKL